MRRASGIIGRMNPLLGKLHPYPFERLRELSRDIRPAPGLSPINLGIGEPRHATPELIRRALIEVDTMQMVSVCIMGVTFRNS